MAEFLLYGINERGAAAHSELLRGVTREALRQIAETRLARWHAVEIWEGPMCLVRLRRQPSEGADI